MPTSKLARIEAYSGDGPAAVWASERRREPTSVRRPLSFATLLDRQAHDQPAAAKPLAPPPKPRKQTPSEALAAQPLAEIIEHLPGAVALLDRDMIILGASRAWATDLRLNLDSQVVGASFFDFFDDCAEYWHRQHKAVLAGERVLRARDSFERPDGLIITLERTMLPVRGQNGAVVGMVMALAIEEMSYEATDQRSTDILRFLETR